MTRQEALDGIVKLLKTINAVDQSRLDGISEETDFIADLDIASTDIINIIAKAENEFDIEFDDDDVDELGTKVKDTIDLILKTVNP